MLFFFAQFYIQSPPYNHLDHPYFEILFQMGTLEYIRCYIYQNNLFLKYISQKYYPKNLPNLFIPILTLIAVPFPTFSSSIA